MGKVEQAIMGRIRRILDRDGLLIRDFQMLAFAYIIVDSPLTYRELLREYAEYTHDVPERLHADLCRRLLMAGFEISPADYLRYVREEVMNP